jgi:multidrug efflux pump subunit AcrA (membrane-fusion protein)
MTNRTRASWPVYALGASCIAAIVAAVLVVGPAPASQSSVTRTAKVAQGVVQSTVSGTGNLEPISQLDLGFKTGGTVTRIYVKQGQEVAAGQLLATLDPQSAEVILEQAKASLESAEANLSKEEETGGEGASSQSAGGSAGATAGAASASTTTSTTKRPAAETKTSSPGTTSTVSPATREANLASARAAVKSDGLSVQSDEQAVQDTRLYAPEDGTIASLAGQVGEVVSGSGTTRVSSSSSSSSSSGAGATGGATAGRGASSTAASSSSSGSSSAGFAVLANLSSMELVVPLSESEIGSVRRGQPATVTVEALAGSKFAAHVSEVAILSTSNSGVVSYDVTFKLDQMEAALKPGMSASAEVVVKQAVGINVPTSAITAGTVTVVRAGKQVHERVTTGLAGDSSTLVLSGLKAGETIVLPSATTSTSGRGSTGTSRLGGGGGLGGAGFGAGGGPPAFFRGGG